MPHYELVLEGVLSDDSISEVSTLTATKHDDTTVLQGELSSQEDLLRVLEIFEALGLGLRRLRQVQPSEE